MRPAHFAPCRIAAGSSVAQLKYWRLGSGRAPVKCLSEKNAFIPRAAKRRRIEYIDGVVHQAPKRTYVSSESSIRAKKGKLVQRNPPICAYLCVLLAGRVLYQ